ncbi:sulfotransferase family protein [Rubrobacter naiadicus]|uniref:sulfotransferase family protein n=1 Tax=Rubrobacter naiadicus TaxID=1392641 RepID=UPI00235EDA3F|nr:sulfotransferase [Rubrobacter naiadicus]
MKGRTLAEQALSGLYVDVGGDEKDSVFVAGSGRSGTTWLAEALCARGGCRLIFEPFCPWRVGTVHHFSSKQYLRPDDARPEYLDPARAIVTGRIRDRWTDRLHKSFVARRRVIKDIRANLLLGWLHHNFPEMPLILIIRHPCAVAASRLSLGWRDNLEEVLSQRDLLEDFLRPFEHQIRRAGTPFERHVFLWCIDNYVPLAQLGPGALHVVFYEELLADPQTTLTRLFRALGEDRPPGRVLRSLRRPSATSGPGGLRVSRAQAGRVERILSLFGLERIYDEDGRPDRKELTRIMEGGTQPDRAKGH